MSYYLIAHTQNLENYGAHDWDGGIEGPPQYWKFKCGASLALQLEGDELTSRRANYVARCLEQLAEHGMLEANDYFKTYYIDHEVVEARDLYIALDSDDHGPEDYERYEFVGYVYFPHLGKSSRHCWKRRR